MNGIHGPAGPKITRRSSSSLACSERFHLASAIVGQTYVIDVARPPTSTPPSGSVPVIYVLDGNSLFAMTCQIARLLELDPRGIPSAVVVGIGYPTDSSLEGNRERRSLRIRDLTPTEDVFSVRRVLAGREEFPVDFDIQSGGSANFRMFIEEELQPFIRGELQIHALDQTLVGMSLGGLFAMETLLSFPSLFGRWIAVSPSIWWDGRVLLNVGASVDSWRENSRARVFMCVGGAEDAETQCDALELATRLESRRHASLELEFMEFPGETHQSVFPGAVSRGLRSVFGSLSP